MTERNLAPSRATFWNDANIERLRELVSEGRSSSNIGAELGVSRNAVIGQARRQGLRLMGGNRGPVAAQGRPKPRAERPAAPAPHNGFAAVNAIRVAESRERAPAPRKAPAPCPEASPITIVSITNSVCRWPLFDDPNGPVEETLYCGAATGGEPPYCPHHAKLAVAARLTSAETKIAAALRRRAA